MTRPSHDPTSARSRTRVLVGALMPVFTAILALGPATSARAQDLRMGAELTAAGMVFDNFFQAPEDAIEETVTAGSVDARVGPRLSGTPVWIYGRAGATAYEELDTSLLLGAGVLVDADRHALDLQVSRETDRPTLDVGDEVEPATVVRALGEYGFRVTEDWELKALGEIESHEFEISEGQNGETAKAGAAIRWRGLGYDFSPEVGATMGARDADDPVEDYDQSEVYVQLRSAPTRRLYLSGRYRLRTRDYSVDDPSLANFGREDTRHQLVALVDYVLTGPLSAYAYWAWEDADSTRETRVFTARYLILGLKARW